MKRCESEKLYFLNNYKKQKNNAIDVDSDECIPSRDCDKNYYSEAQNKKNKQSAVRSHSIRSSLKKDDGRNILVDMKEEINQMSKNIKHTDQRVESYLKHELQNPNSFSDNHHVNKNILFYHKNNSKPSINLKKVNHSTYFRESNYHTANNTLLNRGDQKEYPSKENTKEITTPSSKMIQYSIDHDNQSKCYQMDSLQVSNHKESYENKKNLELENKVNHYRKQMAIVQAQKNSIESKYESLEKEYAEMKTNLIDTIENMKAEKISACHDECMKSINEYIEQIRIKDKEIKDMDEIINENHQAYQKNLQTLMNQQDELKRHLEPSEAYEAYENEIKRLNEVLSVKKHEVIAIRDELEVQKYDFNEMNNKYAVEKEMMINQIVQLSQQETDNSHNIINENIKLKSDIQGLIKEMDHLHLRLKDDVSQEELYQKNIKEFNEKYDKKHKELKETKELYNTLLNEYKQYQISMVKTIKEMNNDISIEVKEANLLADRKIQSEKEKQDNQLKELNNQLKSNKTKIEELTSEIELLQTNNRTLKKDIAEKERCFYKEKNALEEKIKTLLNDNDQLNEKVMWQSDELSNIKGDMERNFISGGDYIDKVHIPNDSDTLQLNMFNSQPLKHDQEKNYLLRTKRKNDDENQQLKNIINKLQSDIQMYQNQFHDASMKNDYNNQQIEQEYQGIVNELNRTQTILQQANYDNEELKEESQALKSQLNNEIKEKGQLKIELITLKQSKNDNSQKQKQEPEFSQRNNTNVYSSCNDPVISKDKTDLPKLKGKVNKLQKQVDSDDPYSLIAKYCDNNYYEDIQVERQHDKDNDTRYDQHRLMNIIDEMNEKNSHIVQQKKEAENEISRIKTAYDQLVFETKYLTKQDNQPQSDIKEYLSKIDQLNKVIENMSHESAVHKMEVEGYKANIDKLTKELQGLRDNEKLSEEKDKPLTLPDLMTIDKDNQEDPHNNLIDNNDKRIASLTEQNRTLLIEVSKIQHLEMQIQKLKIDNETLNELKEENEHNKKLLAQFELKTKEMEQINNQRLDKTDISKDKPKCNESEEIVEISSLSLHKDDTKEEDEIAMKIRLFKDTILSLQNDLKEKDTLIEKLQQENNELKSLKESNKDNEIKVKTSEQSVSSVNNEEKCAKYKKAIDEYRLQQKSSQDQIIMLKKEIRDLRTQLDQILSFEGKIESYEDYLSTFKTAFENYKPNKSEQEDAYKKLLNHLKGYTINESVIS